MIKECPYGCVTDVDDDWINFCEQCGEELVEEADSSKIK